MEERGSNNNNTNNAIKIAVVEEQIRGVREQQKSHAEAVEKRFTETAHRFDDVDAKLEVLLGTLNKGKGAYAVLFLTSGFIGAAVIQFITFIFKTIKIGV